MTDAAVPTARPRRRTQAERSSTTRAALTNAAIAVVHRHGYGATTAAMVAEEAGVTRGAMLHHFGNKVELMLHVVESVYADEIEHYRPLFAAITDQRAMIVSLPEILWAVLSRPSGVAVLEILIGSRSDPELAERLLPLQQRIEREAYTLLHKRVGLDAHLTLPLTRLIVWAIRGLSIAQVVMPDPAADIGASVRMFKTILEAAFDAGVTIET
jgi:AcrR family transcriptional regulator